jgi:4-hydroxyisophthalate hydroxylase
MTPESERPQVAIVGGGPVGTGLAIELARRNVRCTVVERYPQPHPVPRGQNLTQRTLEHFHFWGIEPALRAARTIPRDYGIGGMTAYGQLLGDYSHDWLQRELVRPYYFTDNERLPQYATEAVLRRRARDFPQIETLYGWSADGLEQDAAGARVAIVSRAEGTRKTICADYVVGCDGSRSVVREAAGITETRSDHDRLMVLLVFRSTELHELLKRYPGKSFYNVLHPDLKGYWQFFGRVDLGATWFFHAPVPRGTTKDNLDFRQLLYKAVGAEFDVEFEHIGFWDLRFAVADAYRNQRVFIAGDAAHSHPPYGGYGINTGLEDAVNLGWKLAATLQGWGGPRLLESYAAERRGVFQSTARDFIEKSIHTDRDFLEAFNPTRDRRAFEREWSARKLGARSEVGAYEPHYEGSPVVWGPPDGVCGALGGHAFGARAGHHLAPQPLSSGANVFDVLGQGYALLAFGAEPSRAQVFAQAGKALATPLTIVEDTCAGGREKYDADLVLVRPDQFVAWTSREGPGDATEVLSRAIGAARPRKELRPAPADC